MYATLNDLQMRFGAKNLNKWANLEGDGSMNAQRINTALLKADNLINSLLNGKWYLVPLQFQDQISQWRVTEWAVVFAGHWLYISQGLLATEGEKDVQAIALQSAYKNVMNEIDRVINNTMSLNCVPRWAPNPRAPSCV